MGSAAHGGDGLSVICGYFGKACDDFVREDISSGYGAECLFCEGRDVLAMDPV